MSVVELQSNDHESNFRFLMGCARNGNAPGFSLDGKPERDLIKVALTLPADQEIPARFEEVVAEIFTKKQSGYRRTGVNLAHRTNQLASAARRRSPLLLSLPALTTD